MGRPKQKAPTTPVARACKVLEKSARELLLEARAELRAAARFATAARREVSPTDAIEYVERGVERMNAASVALGEYRALLNAMHDLQVDREQIEGTSS